MSARPPASPFPTLHKLRRKLAGLDSFPRWHFRATILGLVAIVALGAGFAAVTAQEQTAEAARAREFAILRHASTAETNLASIALAHRTWLLTSQPAALAQFRRGCHQFRERLLDLIPLLREEPARRDAVRGASGHRPAQPRKPAFHRSAFQPERFSAGG